MTKRWKARRHHTNAGVASCGCHSDANSAFMPVGEDIFPDYTKEGFEAAFSDLFEIASAESIEGSERTLYLLRRK